MDEWIRVTVSLRDSNARNVRKLLDKTPVLHTDAAIKRFSVVSASGIRIAALQVGHLPV